MCRPTFLLLDPRLRADQGLRSTTPRVIVALGFSFIAWDVVIVYPLACMMSCCLVSPSPPAWPPARLKLKSATTTTPQTPCMSRQLLHQPTSPFSLAHRHAAIRLPATPRLLACFRFVVWHPCAFTRAPLISTPTVGHRPVLHAQTGPVAGCGLLLRRNRTRRTHRALATHFSSASTLYIAL